MPEIMMPNILGTVLGVQQGINDQRQQGFQNQLASRQAQMEEQRFAQEQADMERQTLVNQLIGQYLGPDTVDALGAPQNRQGMISQIAAIDPQRAFQVERFRAQQQALQRQQKQAEAQEIVSYAQYALQSQDPVNLLKVGLPEFAKQMTEAGIDVDNLTDEDVRMYAQTLIEQFAPIAGIAPAGNEFETVTVAEGGAVIDPRTGREIYKNPKSRDTSGDEKDAFNRANVLRDEFTALAKDYMTVKSSYDTIQATAREPSAAGDLSLLTAYMKMLDPASTVREGEFANAQNAGGVPERIQNTYNKLMSGERLVDSQRADFVKQAGNVLKSRESQYVKNRDKYKTLATRAKVDPIDVVGEEEVVVEETATPSGSAPKPGTIQDGYRFKGGDPANPASWEKQ